LRRTHRNGFDATSLDQAGGAREQPERHPGQSASHRIRTMVSSASPMGRRERRASNAALLPVTGGAGPCRDGKDGPATGRVRRRPWRLSLLAVAFLRLSICAVPPAASNGLGLTEDRLRLVRLPATAVADFFPPPAALHREAKKPSPAAFH